MTAMLANFKQNKLGKAWEKFMSCHPYLTFITLFVGMPLLTLATVWLGTAVIFLPFYLIMG